MTPIAGTDLALDLGIGRPLSILLTLMEILMKIIRTEHRVITNGTEYRLQSIQIIEKVLSEYVLNTEKEATEVATKLKCLPIQNKEF